MVVVSNVIVIVVVIVVSVCVGVGVGVAPVAAAPAPSASSSTIAAPSRDAFLDVVNARGEFISDNLELFASTHFPNDNGAVDCATLVKISVLRPRGSGKSELGNRLFSTSFQESRPFSGTSTRGCVAIVSEVLRALILDMQGSDGRDGN